MTNLIRVLLVAVLVGNAAWGQTAQNPPRARDVGIRIGIFDPGPLNAITDVPGVLVGQTTIIRGDDIRTGVTAILPHAGNMYQEKVPGAIVVFNGFGKLAGSTQVHELGEIETPILLTSTLAVPSVAHCQRSGSTGPHRVSRYPAASHVPSPCVRLCAHAARSVGV